MKVRIKSKLVDTNVVYIVQYKKFKLFWVTFFKYAKLPDAIKDAELLSSFTPQTWTAEEAIAWRKAHE